MSKHLESYQRGVEAAERTIAKIEAEPRLCVNCYTQGVAIKMMQYFLAKLDEDFVETYLDEIFDLLMKKGGAETPPVLDKRKMN